MGDNLPAVNLGDHGIPPIEVVCGQGHTCVRFANKKLKCFGANGQGENGYGDTINRGETSSNAPNNWGFLDLS